MVDKQKNSFVDKTRCKKYRYTTTPQIISMFQTIFQEDPLVY